MSGADRALLFGGVALLALATWGGPFGWAVVPGVAMLASWIVRRSPPSRRNGPHVL